MNQPFCGLTERTSDFITDFINTFADRHALCKNALPRANAEACITITVNGEKELIFNVKISFHSDKSVTKKHRDLI